MEKAKKYLEELLEGAPLKKEQIKEALKELQEEQGKRQSIEANIIFVWDEDYFNTEEIIAMNVNPCLMIDPNKHYTLELVESKNAII